MFRSSTKVALPAFLILFSLACGGTEETPPPAPEPAPAPAPEPEPEPEPEEPWCCAYDGEDGKMYVQTADAKACTEKFAEQNGAYVKDAACANAQADEGGTAEPGEPEPADPAAADPAAADPAPAGPKPTQKGVSGASGQRGVGTGRGDSTSGGTKKGVKH